MVNIPKTKFTLKNTIFLLCLQDRKVYKLSSGIMVDHMEENISEETFSKMFVGKQVEWETDEELALHIIHKFNICRDTMETMPAFNEHLELLFSKEKEK